MSNYIIAKSYHEAGLNVIPLRDKRNPKIKYAKYHEYPYPWYLCQKWFFSKGCPSGIAVICGKTSGNLEVIDFDKDCSSIFREWYRRILDNPTTTQISTTLPLVCTPKDGIHVFYKSRTIEASQKLAMDGDDVRVETRGQGGYVATVGTPRHMHPRNRPYRLLRGSLTEIPTITPQQREVLLDIARGFHVVRGGNAGVARTPASPNGTQTAPNRTQAGLSRSPSIRPTSSRPRSAQNRPGDKFNQNATWEDILIPHGWTVSHKVGEVEYWTRPNKIDGGWSATVNYGGLDKLIVHSTSTPFEATSRSKPRSYDKFSAYAILCHEGDYSEAARELNK